MHDDEVCLAFRSNRFEELLAESGNDVNMIIYLHGIAILSNRKNEFSVGVLQRRLLHRNGNFVPPAP